MRCSERRDPIIRAVRSLHPDPRLGLGRCSPEASDRGPHQHDQASHEPESEQPTHSHESDHERPTAFVHHVHHCCSPSQLAESTASHCSMRAVTVAISARVRVVVPFSTTEPSSEPRGISIREGLKRSLNASRTEDAAYPVPTNAANVIEVPTIRAKNRCMESPFAAAGRSPALSSQWTDNQPRSTIVF